MDARLRRGLGCTLLSLSVLVAQPAVGSALPSPLPKLKTLDTDATTLDGASGDFSVVDASIGSCYVAQQSSPQDWTVAHDQAVAVSHGAQANYTLARTLQHEWQLLAPVVDRYFLFKARTTREPKQAAAWRYWDNYLKPRAGHQVALALQAYSTGAAYENTVAQLVGDKHDCDGARAARNNMLKVWIDAAERIRTRVRGHYNIVGVLRAFGVAAKPYTQPFTQVPPDVTPPPADSSGPIQ